MSATASPFDDLLGVRIVHASADLCVATLTVGPQLLQPGGVVHGGVYTTLTETAASVGANAWLDDDEVAVGVTNHTEFLRPVRQGELTARATPLQQGRRMQAWRVAISTTDGTLVAHGTLRLAHLRLGGER